MLEQLTLQDTVLDSAREVFETMIFMDIETSSDACPSITGESLLGSITFKGDLEGCLAVCVSQSCADRIAKNMLGMEADESLTIEEACDAIGEVANMVMGSIKSRLQPLYPTLEVSIPSVITGRELKNTLGERAVKTIVCAWLDEQEAAEFSFLYRKSASQKTQ